MLRQRWLNYFIVQCGKQVLIQQRTSADVWHHLHQFFLIETDAALPAKKLEDLFRQQAGLQDYTVIDHWTGKQTLSHQSIAFTFFHVRLAKRKPVAGYQWMPLDAVSALAFPKTLQQAVQHLTGEAPLGGAGQLF